MRGKREEGWTEELELSEAAGKRERARESRAFSVRGQESRLMQSRKPVRWTSLAETVPKGGGQAYAFCLV